tara:strand:- start:173 stop:445 length:273 start_codon:yes stop_codon:yes gene_type:complete
LAYLIPLLLLVTQITTVDKYQGQQNDYILLSLVRTKAVGHIRDVRRLVVAMSRARLGLVRILYSILFILVSSDMRKLFSFLFSFFFFFWD